MNGDELGTRHPKSESDLSITEPQNVFFTVHHVEVGVVENSC